MITQYKAPEQFPEGKLSIFLGGTIDNGDSEDWQNTAFNFLKLHKKFDNWIVLNPRRYNWNVNACITDVEDQIKWELHALDHADILIMNFLPNSQSPISLFEMGLYARHKKIRVCCPKEFWKSTNVRYYCKVFNIPLFDNLQTLLQN